MELRWWWLGLAWIVGCAALAWWFLATAHRPGRRDDSVLLAHTDVVRRSPRYSELVRAHVRRLTLQLVGVVLVLAGAAVLLARPASTATTDPQARNRDIMLCLDASGSMFSANHAVMQAYSRIAEGLRGDRIGLTIFSASAVTVFPLTDDETFVKEQLDEAARAFDNRDVDFVAGIGGSYSRASQIGDGLVSCTQRFDQKRPDRPRVLVLASDNDIIGEPIFTLEEAAAHATRSRITVIGISPQLTVDRDAFRTACQSTGGDLVELDSSDAVDTIVQRIGAMNRTTIDNPAPRTIVDDRPGLGIGIVTFGVLLLLASTLRWPARWPTRWPTGWPTGWGA